MRRSNLIAFLLLWICLPSGAISFRSGDNPTILQSSVINDDLAIAGGTVTVGGTINGDLLAAGGTIYSNAGITNDLDIVGGTINVNGPVGHSLRAAGGTITLSSTVGANALIGGGNVVVDSKAVITRDLVLGAGTTSLSGRVEGNVLGSGGQISISGPVKGNVTIQADQLKLEPGAVIGGNLSFTGPQRPVISPQARVVGRTIYHPTPKSVSHRRAGSRIWSWFYWLVTLLVSGLVVYALLPNLVLTASTLVRYWPMSLLVGFLASFLAPFMFLVLMITLFGIPLAIFFLFAYLFFLLIGLSIAGLALGRWILEKLKAPNVKVGWAWLLGLAILLLVTMIPFLGGIIKFIALLLGFGALLRASYERYQTARAAKTL